MQDNESEESFACFVAYRDLPPRERSLIAAATLVGRTVRTLAEHSTKHRWVSRARAWDRRRDQARTRSELTAIERMHARHKRLAIELQEVTAIELERLLRQANRRLRQNAQDDNDPITSLDNLSKVHERAVRIERLAEGEATDINEGRLNFDGMSVDEMMQLRSLLMKAKGNQ